VASPAALEDLAWKDDAQDWLDSWAWSGLTFTAEDMRRAFRLPPHPNMTGAAFQAARHRGVIRAVGFIESTTPSRNRAVIRVWRGVTEGVTP
jgi:hypothetical protein